MSSTAFFQVVEYFLCAIILFALKVCKTLRFGEQTFVSRSKIGYFIFISEFQNNQKMHENIVSFPPLGYRGKKNGLDLVRFTNDLIKNEKEIRSSYYGFFFLLQKAVKFLTHSLS